MHKPVIDPRIAAAVPERTRPLILAVAAVAAGIGFDRYHLPIEIDWFLWWSAGTLLALGSWLVARFGFERLAGVPVLLSLVAVGAGWHHLRWDLIDSDHLARFARERAEPTCVEAIAVGRIRHRPAPTNSVLRAIPVGPSSELLVEATRIRDGRHWRPTTGQCRLRIAGNLAGVEPGDRLRIFARFGRLSPALNPGQYDWAARERGAGRHFELYCRSPACITVVEQAAGWSLMRPIQKAAQRCEMRLAHYVGPEQADLALAVLLGARERLDAQTVEAFLETGTVHLLVVSGLHVGMLAMVLWQVVRFGLISRRSGIGLTALCVLAYAAITGGRPPVMRATVLVLLTLAGLRFARRVRMTNLLAVAALCVLAYSPSELFQSGTQLSFLCVAVLVGYGNLIDRSRPADPLARLICEAMPWYRKLGAWCVRHAKHMLLASFAVWLMASPLVAHHFHITTPVGITLSPLLWVAIAVALASGLAICAFAWVIPPLAAILGSICSWSLGWTRLLVHGAVSLGVGGPYCSGPALWWVAGFYGGLAATNLVPQLRIGWRWQASLAALWMAWGFVGAAIPSDEKSLHCTFLAMGHGTCVVLELPGDQTILYDAGSLGSPRGASRIVAGYLWSRGIRRIDAVVLSHADVDHYNALPGLTKYFDVGVVYTSPMMFDPWSNAGELTAPNYLRQELKQARVPLEEIWLADHLKTADPRVEIEVLHPPRTGTLGRDNANSVLLAVRFCGKSILLPGDLESPGIEAVMAEEPIDVDILLAPHHGSSRSDPPGFAAWCRPNWTIVSGEDVEEDQQRTAMSYRRLGSRVLHTSECGAVRFSLAPEGIHKTQFRISPPANGRR